MGLNHWKNGYTNFLQTYNISSKTISGESKSVNENMVLEYKENQWIYIDFKGEYIYNPVKQVFILECTRQNITLKGDRFN